VILYLDKKIKNKILNQLSSWVSSKFDRLICSIRVIFSFFNVFFIFYFKIQNTILLFVINDLFFYSTHNKKNTILLFVINYLLFLSWSHTSIMVFFLLRKYFIQKNSHTLYCCVIK
jgi:hypothetical protein